MNSSPIKILVVDDDDSICELLAYNLTKEGFKVKRAKDGLQAIEKAMSFLPDIILLDVMIPKMDGIEACCQLKLKPELKHTHIIFLTARSEEFSEIAAFDAGADDYLLKPIKPRALISRIQSVIRKINKHKDQLDQLTVGELFIDRAAYHLRVKDTWVELPKKQFELLYFLALHSNKVFSRDELLNHVWGTDVSVLSRTVDVHIRKVREAIGEDYIQTVKGIGYKFTDER